MTLGTGGYYEGTEGRHEKFFNGRGIGHNTPLIADPNSPYIAHYFNLHTLADSVLASLYLEGSPPGLGPSVGSPCIPTQYRLANSQIGNVSRFSPENCYVMCDLTNGYPSRASIYTLGTTCRTVTRQILYTGDKFIVVADRVLGVSASAVIKIPWHWMMADSVGDEDYSWSGGTAPNAHGGTPGQWTTTGNHFWWDSKTTRMWVSVLAPDTRKVWRIGGKNSAGEWNKPDSGGDPSFDFWMPGLQRTFAYAPITGDYKLEQFDMFGLYPRGRLSIEATGDTAHVFLTLLEATNTRATAPTYSAALDTIDALHAGCRIDAVDSVRVAVFSINEEADTTATYTVTSTLPVRHYLADVPAGSYWAYGPGASDSVAVTVGADLLATWPSATGGAFSFGAAAAEEEPLPEDVGGDEDFYLLTR